MGAHRHMTLLSRSRGSARTRSCRSSAPADGRGLQARDTRLDRIVAVKLLLAEVADRPDRRLRFEAEARAISSLSHPHICTLFDVGEQDGRAFLSWSIWKARPSTTG